MPDQNLIDTTQPVANPVPKSNLPPAPTMPTATVTEELPIPMMGGLDVPPPSPIVEESPDTATTVPADGIPTDGEKKPKKKVSGKIIATILGILILVGGLGTGLYLVGQQQDLRNRATGEYAQWDACAGQTSDKCFYYDCSQKIQCSGSGANGTIVLGFCGNLADYPQCGGGDENDVNCTGGGYACSSNEQCCSGFCDPASNNCGTESNGNGNGGACTPVSDPTVSCIPDHESPNACNANGERCTTIYVGENGWTEPCCTGISSTDPNAKIICGNPKYYCISGGYCIENATCDYRPAVGCVVDPTCNGTPNGTGTPPTETPAVPFCQEISAYDSAWTKLSADGLKALKAGDKIYLTVKGGNGSFDKAKFQINTGAWTDSTNLKSGTTNEYYYEYTLENLTSFTVNAQVHTTAGEWK